VRQKIFIRINFNHLKNSGQVLAQGLHKKYGIVQQAVFAKQEQEIKNFLRR